jgi:hypothetical protein
MPKHVGEQHILKLEAIQSDLQEKNAYDFDKL